MIGVGPLQLELFYSILFYSILFYSILFYSILFYSILITTLDFRRANFGLFQDLLGGIKWVRALEGRGVQESWLLFNRDFLHAQDW